MMWNVIGFRGKLPEGFSLQEDVDSLYLFYKGKEIGRFSKNAEVKEIEEAAEEYLSSLGQLQ